VSQVEKDWLTPSYRKYLSEMGAKGGVARGGRKADASRANAEKAREIKRLRRLGLLK
jgi:hypothetical protein